ncbi:MAG: hypothetical protein JWM27_1331 [Gemmatimonadetes bacterium]|nr:hypothetical protein [Gemmatimonadota bacterium]
MRTRLRWCALLLLGGFVFSVSSAAGQAPLVTWAEAGAVRSPDLGLRWVQVMDERDHAMFADRESITVTPAGVASAWLVSVYRHPQFTTAGIQYDNQMVRWEFVCRTRQGRVGSVVYYNDTVVARAIDALPQDSWTEVPPGSVMEELLHMACRSVHPAATVRRVTETPVPPSALCRDGTYSYSTHRRGTCARHHGVRTWLHRPRT